MRIQKFINNHILKSTEWTTVTENNNINIELTDDELNASLFEKIVNAKIVKIDPINSDMFFFDLQHTNCNKQCSWVV